MEQQIQSSDFRTTKSHSGCTLHPLGSTNQKCSFLQFVTVFYDVRIFLKLFLPKQHCRLRTDERLARSAAGCRSHHPSRNLIANPGHTTDLTSGLPRSSDEKFPSRFRGNALIADTWQMIDGDHERSVSRWRRRVCRCWRVCGGC